MLSVTADTVGRLAYKSPDLFPLAIVTVCITKQAKERHSEATRGLSSWYANFLLQDLQRGERQRQREIEIFHLLVQYPNDRNSYLSLLEARSLLRVPQQGYREDLNHLLLFPHMSQTGFWIRGEAPRTRPGILFENAGAAGIGLACYATALAPL